MTYEPILWVLAVLGVWKLWELSAARPPRPTAKFVVGPVTDKHPRDEGEKKKEP